MSKALAEKAAIKKRPASTGEAPPPKMSNAFTAKNNNVDRPTLPKFGIPPMVEKTAMVPYAGKIGLAPPIASKQPDAVAILDEAEGAGE